MYQNEAAVWEILNGDSGPFGSGKQGVRAVRSQVRVSSTCRITCERRSSCWFTPGMLTVMWIFLIIARVGILGNSIPASRLGCITAFTTKP